MSGPLNTLTAQTGVCGVSYITFMILFSLTHKERADRYEARFKDVFERYQSRLCFICIGQAIFYSIYTSIFVSFKGAKEYIQKKRDELCKVKSDFEEFRNASSMKAKDTLRSAQ